MSAFSFLHVLRACLPCVMCLLLCRGDMFVLVPCIPLTDARVLFTLTASTWRGCGSACWWCTAAWTATPSRTTSSGSSTPVTNALQHCCLVLLACDFLYELMCLFVIFQCFFFKILFVFFLNFFLFVLFLLLVIASFFLLLYFIIFGFFHIKLLTGGLCCRALGVDVGAHVRRGATGGMRSRLCLLIFLFSLCWCIHSLAFDRHWVRRCAVWAIGSTCWATSVRCTAAGPTASGTSSCSHSQQLSASCDLSLTSRMMFNAEKIT